MEIVIRCRKDNVFQKQNRCRQNDTLPSSDLLVKPGTQRFLLPNYPKQHCLDITKEDISKVLVEAQPFSVNQQQEGNSVVYIKQYSKELRQQSLKMQMLGNFLEKHHVDATLRARMLDWMTEVTISYQFDAKTYFDGVQLLDRYLAAEQRIVEAGQLHTIGVAAMLLASKSNQVRPLRIRTAYQKIGHRKIPMNQLSLAEADIMKTLQYKLNQWTFYDTATVKLAPYQLPNALPVLAYIGRVIIINYNFYVTANPLLLGEAAAWVTMRVLGKVMRGLQEVVECGQEVVELIKNFKCTYPGMRNAIRFTQRDVIKSIQDFIDSN